jgi:serine/threonine-protein kinase
LKVCPQCATEYPANARFCEIDGTALRSAQSGTDLVGTIVADRYHVLRKLGEGGMGQVYLAEHVKMGRKSALKVMRSGMKADVDAVSRFNREAANASRIAHPNVAAIYDFGETPDGIIYLAMEYVDGPPLTKIIEQQGALPPKRAAEIVRQAAEGLAVAHDMGIVHRDLKPDNIMIARNRDGSDCVKVVDFGIAKAAGNSAQNVTKTGLVVGTPEYMSPEQLAGDTLDGRSDTYSLGLVAYNMLTGKLPFPSESAQESMIMRLTDNPRPLAAMKPETPWPADVQAVMDRALARDASARYRNAIDFGMALYNAIDRMPETRAMEGGTQVIERGDSATRRLGDSAVPATRVAGGHGAAPTVTQVAAGSKKSNKLAVMVAGAVVVAAAAVIGAMKYGAPQNTPPNVDQLARQRPPAEAPKNPTVGDTSTTHAENSQPVDVDAQLAALLNDAQARVTADAALRKVGTLDLKTNDQKAEAAYVRAKAFLTKDDKGSACKELKDIVEVFPGSKRVHDAKNLIEVGC